MGERFTVRLGLSEVLDILESKHEELDGDLKRALITKVV